MRATLTAPPPPRSTPATVAANTSRTPFPTPFTIIVDTREQAPFSFANLRCNSSHSYRPIAPTIIHQGLSTGDYSLAGHTSRVVIERKSLSDLFGSLAGKDGERRRRFKAEHERMWEIVRFGGFAHVVIEGTREDARTFNEQFNGRAVGASPAAVLSASIRWPRRYGVTWHWAGSRSEAERLTYELLADVWSVFDDERKDEERRIRNEQIEVLKNQVQVSKGVSSHG